MAGDWIKMRTDLYRDPKVCVMADILLDLDSELAQYINQNFQRDMTVTRNVMRNAVVGALVSVWGVMRLRGKRDNIDLICTGANIHILDDISDLQGFGLAMKEVGWVVTSDENDQYGDNVLVFPSFFEDYNVDPTDAAKEKNKERQRRFREKDSSDKENSNAKSNVTHNADITHREEKRREENKGIIALNPIAEAILAYLNKKALRAYKPVKANIGLIVARLKEGATPDELRAVIDSKVQAWLSDPKMNQYLRPETLFNASKFANYVGELGASQNGLFASNKPAGDPRFAGAK